MNKFGMWFLSTALGVAAWNIARWSASLSDWPYVGTVVLFWVLLGLFSATERVRIRGN